jgi:hypothetical protein
MLEEETYNKLKIVEINTYYGKSYNAHAGLMKSIVFFCIPILILSFLLNREILPQSVGIILISIIIVWAVISITRQIFDMINRDNMNYDEYNWRFNAATAPKGNIGPVTDPWASVSELCIGSECCNEGSTYDSTKNLCIPNTTCAAANTTDSNPNYMLSNVISSGSNLLSSGANTLSGYSTQFSNDVSSLF